MFGGLFKPGGAKYDGGIDSRINMSDGPDELKK